MKIFILLLALFRCEPTRAGCFDGPVHIQLPQISKTDEHRASFLRSQIRALRLEISFVEERIVRTRRELQLEICTLTGFVDLSNRLELEREVRAIFAQREARLVARIGALKNQLEKLEGRLAKACLRRQS